MSRFSLLRHKQKQENISSRIGEFLALIDTTRMRIALIASIMLLGGTYLWLVNSSASAGFYVSDLEKQVLALEDEYHKLGNQQTALQSLESIQQRIDTSKMVASGKADYLQTTDSAVAFGNK
ncbi:MAG: hypothetical protein HYV32_02940 [Candidatus Kerfeldbacteria bacterium]|nr:hypothetical protein [Candidatus Kerfeldbacteria bacterium]